MLVFAAKRGSRRRETAKMFCISLCSQEVRHSDAEIEGIRRGTRPRSWIRIDRFAATTSAIVESRWQLQRLAAADFAGFLRVLSRPSDDVLAAVYSVSYLLLCVNERSFRAGLCSLRAARASNYKRSRVLYAILASIFL